MQAWGFVLSAGLMGLAGAPHCAAMCAAPCAAALRGCGRPAVAHPTFQAGRLLGYAAAGAVVASAVGALPRWAAWTPALQPLWTLLHLAALALSLVLLVMGRMPVWRSAAAIGSPLPQGWQRIAGPTRSLATGAAWIAWPCALSQSALLLASLSGDAVNGAASMAAFALASAPGIAAGPWLLGRLIGPRGESWTAGTWPLRLAGGTVAAMSLWALSHDLLHRVAAWCVS